MRSWLIRVVTALAAVLFGALPLAPVLATVSEGATYTYTYDLHGLYAATPHGTTERGPPATRNNPITYDPNGLRTLGVSARSHTPTTPATYDYDDLARFVRTARGSHGAEGQPRGLNGDLCALLSVRSAAKAGSSKVNPLGGTQNCVNCVIAGDNTLAGFPTSPLDSAGPQLISRIEQHFGASFKSVGGQSDVADILANAGPGARGIVFGARGSDPGHVFNAINQGGVVRFIDFQSGRAASFNGYSGFSFLRTN